MRSGRLRAAALVGGIVLVAGACGGGPEFTYLESDDGHLFAKIPHDWQVSREGAVDYKLINKDAQVQFAFTTGDTTRPWRAEFQAEGDAGDVPRGFVEAQHVDARWRETFLLSQMIDVLRPNAQDLERRKVRVGDYSGYRVTFTTGEDDDLRRYEELYLMDERRSAVYYSSVDCSEECVDRYADQIAEVVESLRVEP